MSLELGDGRAPYVTFEQRAVEDRTLSISSGQYRTKDVDFALITPAGSKDQVEREVADWFDHLAREVINKRFSAEWLRAYKFAYTEWKEGRELPVDGTPIANWGVLSPSQLVLLRSLKVQSVEDLAAANESTMTQIGMGARQLVDLAKDFVRANSTGGQNKLISEIAAIREELALLTANNKALEEKNTFLKAQMVNAGAVTEEKTFDPDTSAGGLLENTPVAVTVATPIKRR